MQFLKVGDLHGGSTHQGFVGWIEAEEAAFKPGKPKEARLEVTCWLDVHSPMLRAWYMRGEVIKKVSIRGIGSDALNGDLTNAVIESIVFAGTDNEQNPKEICTFVSVSEK